MVNKIAVVGIVGDKFILVNYKFDENDIMSMQTATKLVTRRSLITAMRNGLEVENFTLREGKVLVGIHGDTERYKMKSSSSSSMWCYVVGYDSVLDVYGYIAITKRYGDNAVVGAAFDKGAELNRWWVKLNNAYMLNNGDIDGVNFTIPTYKYGESASGAPSAKYDTIFTSIGALKAAMQMGSANKLNAEEYFELLSNVLKPDMDINFANGGTNRVTNSWKELVYGLDNNEFYSGRNNYMLDAYMIELIPFGEPGIATLFACEDCSIVDVLPIPIGVKIKMAIVGDWAALGTVNGTIVMDRNSGSIEKVTRVKIDDVAPFVIDRLGEPGDIVALSVKDDTSRDIWRSLHPDGSRQLVTPGDITYAVTPKEYRIIGSKRFIGINSEGNRLYEISDNGKIGEPTPCVFKRTIISNTVSVPVESNVASSVLYGSELSRSKGYLVDINLLAKKSNIWPIIKKTRSDIVSELYDREVYYVKQTKGYAACYTAQVGKLAIDVNGEVTRHTESIRAAVSVEYSLNINVKSDVTLNKNVYNLHAIGYFREESKKPECHGQLLIDGNGSKFYLRDKYEDYIREEDVLDIARNNTDKGVFGKTKIGVASRVLSNYKKGLNAAFICEMAGTLLYDDDFRKKGAKRLVVAYEVSGVTYISVYVGGIVLPLLRVRSDVSADVAKEIAYRVSYTALRKVADQLLFKFKEEIKNGATSVEAEGLSDEELVLLQIAAI